MAKNWKVVVCLPLIILTSCHQEFLNLKPDRKLVVPSTLRDIQALLDNTSVMNEAMPSLGEIGADDYYVLDNRLLSQQSQNRNTYLWAPDIFEGNNGDDWDFRYRQVFYANTVLEQLKQIAHQDNSDIARQSEGSALFYRAWAFYHLSQLFCATYDKNTAKDELGIPLRLNSDITDKSVRASIEQTYRQILDDLLIAVSLLPSQTVVKTRPAKSAAFGLIARVALIKGDYEMALASADSCINSFGGEILDYNEVDTASDYPFDRFNDEVIFHATMFGSTILNPSNLIVDSLLLETYHQNDLRRILYYTNNKYQTFRGSYDNSRTLFSGIAINEIVLVKAECLARLGRELEAINTLNDLLVKRFSRGEYEYLTSQNALGKILSERRKELVFRGIRWSDLRRLNKEPQFEKSLRRVVDNQEYVLPPNDLRYVLPIPDPVVIFTGMPQNPR